MNRVLAPLALSISALTMAAPASAATFIFGTPLAPEAAGATGSGSVELTLDTTARTLGIKADWSGLSGTSTVAHIHCCIAPPGNIGVAVAPGTLPGFPVGSSCGSYSAVLDLADPNTYTAGFFGGSGGGTTEGAQAALLAGLQGGNAYFNLHTTAFPGGEIRGFASAVPEPGAWGLMILGFGLVGAALRRTRRRLPAVA